MLSILHFIVFVVVFEISSALSQRAKSENDSAFCRDQNAILFVQREQIRLARHSLFGVRHHGFLSPSKNLEFYKHSQGTHTVELFGNSKGYSNMIYLRLFKNGNDNIRTLLFNYEKLLCNTSLFFASTEPFECVPFCDFSCPNNYFRTFFKSMSKAFRLEANFSFTFVREPLSRFISAINEVPLPF